MYQHIQVNVILFYDNMDDLVISLPYINFFFKNKGVDHGKATPDIFRIYIQWQEFLDIYFQRKFLIFKEEKYPWLQALSWGTYTLPVPRRFLLL